MSERVTHDDARAAQDAIIASSSDAKWSAGALLHMHTSNDFTNLDAGQLAPPGRVSLCVCVCVFEYGGIVYMYC